MNNKISPKERELPIPNQCKYPKEVFSALTSKKTFAVAAQLFEADVLKGDSPFKVYDSNFSRFVFTVITKDENQNALFQSGNIAINEIFGIIENSRAIKGIDTFIGLPILSQIYSGIKEIRTLANSIQEGLRITFGFLKNGKVPTKQTSEEQNVGQLAKSIQIANGKFKGKTPFEILSDDVNNVKDLEMQQNWLSSNLEKYPNNQKQIDAISEALALLKNGNISKDSISGAILDELKFGDYVIYEASPRALIRKADENGFAPVYEVSILWHLKERYPVEIIIENYKAPITKHENGIINPIKTKAIEKKRGSFRMSSSQWFQCVHSIEAHMRRFEIIKANYQLSIAEKIEEINKSSIINNANPD